jgi:heme-degrading monooxygenase HmoA
MTKRQPILPPWTRLLSAAALSTAVLLSACGGSEPPSPYPASCDKAALEPDFKPTPVSGAGVDPGTHALAAPPAGGHYVVSTTYVALRPDAQPRFNELLGPIMGRLKTQSGIQAITLGTSAACNSARTLTVWADEGSMYDFVGSSEHMTAAMAVGEVSRGDSVVAHRNESDPTKAPSWQAAVQSLAAVSGPLY